MDLSSSHFTTDMRPGSRRAFPSTKPIEIPGKRKSMVASPYLSPIRDHQMLSPDLIFEMSPLTSESTYPLGTSTMQNALDPEPYLYAFPMFSPSHIGNLHCAQSRAYTSPCAENAPDRDDMACHLSSDSWPKPPSAIPSRDENQNADTGAGSPVIKGTPKQKITGFVPLYPSPVSDAPSRRRERLSPPPRSISPWSRLRDVDALEASMRRRSYDFDTSMIRRNSETRKSLLHRASNLRISYRH